MQKTLNKILIIDSNERARAKLKLFFEEQYYEVEEAIDGESGIQLLLERNYDLIIVELMLPGINGVDVCNIVKKLKTIPILILIASGDEKNMLSCLRHGVDDFILKPFSEAEILHRVKALSRASNANTFISNGKKATQLVMPNVVIEWDGHRISKGGQEAYLTPKEYELLCYMTNKPNKILSRDELLKAVWNGEHNLDTRTVDTAIKRLRDKFNKVSPNAAATIKTIWRVGYIFKLKY